MKSRGRVSFSIGHLGREGQRSRLCVRRPPPFFFSFAPPKSQPSSPFPPLSIARLTPGSPARRDQKRWFSKKVLTEGVIYIARFPHRIFHSLYFQDTIEHRPSGREPSASRPRSFSRPALHPLFSLPVPFCPKPRSPVLSPRPAPLAPLSRQWWIITGLRSEVEEGKGEESAAPPPSPLLLLSRICSRCPAFAEVRRALSLPRLKWSTAESRTTKERTNGPRPPSIFDPFVIHHGAPQLGIRHAFLPRRRRRRHRPRRSDLRHGR